MRHQSTIKSSEVGQATTEFIVLCAALVPMLLLFPVLYKYLDMMQSSEQASRYMAFESTVNLAGTYGEKDLQTLTTEVARRVYSRADTQALTLDGVSDDGGERLPLWDDPRGRAILEPVSSIGASNELRDFNAIPSSVPFGSYLAHREFGFERDRLTISTVSVAPNRLPGLNPFDTVNPTINRKTAILVDAWTAGTSDDTSMRFSNMRWLNPLGVGRALFDIVGTLPDLVSDPLITGDGFRGPDAWDTVPCERIRDGC
jgi:hypothetical protein